MGLFFKNKSSYLNTLITSSLFQVLLMSMLAAILFNALYAKTGQSKTILVEMADDAPPAANDQLWAKLTELGLGKNYEFIPKEESIKLLETELGDNFILTEDNPLRDLFKINLLGDKIVQQESIIADLRQEAGVSDIFAQATDVPVTMGSNSTKAKLIKAFILGLFSILTWFYYNSKTSEIVNSAKQMLTSLSLYGAQPAYLKKKYSKSALGITFRSWILGLLLFLLLFSLILNSQNLRITDISIPKLLLVILIPLLVGMMVNILMINKKLENHLKTI